MRYGRLNKTDIANGTGVRVSLFVSGCRNKCKGCFNPETWDFNYGDIVDDKVIDEIIEALKPDYISGLTVLGGDPFEPENIMTVTRIVKLARQLYPNKTIWVYTGYVYDDWLSHHEIMEYIDVLVDGRYIESLKDITLQYRGSSNQRLIDIPATRVTGEIKLWRLNNAN